MAAKLPPEFLDAAKSFVRTADLSVLELLVDIVPEPYQGRADFTVAALKELQLAFDSGLLDGPDGTVSFDLALATLLGMFNSEETDDEPDLSSVAAEGRGVEVLFQVQRMHGDEVKEHVQRFLRGKTDVENLMFQLAIVGVRVAWGLYGGAFVTLIATSVGAPAVMPGLVTSYVGGQLNHVLLELAVTNSELREDTDRFVEAKDLAVRVLRDAHLSLSQAGSGLLESNQIQLEAAFQAIESSNDQDVLAGLATLLALCGAEQDLIDFDAFDEFMLDEATVLVI